MESIAQKDGVLTPSCVSCITSKKARSLVCFRAFEPEPILKPPFKLELTEGSLNTIKKLESWVQKCGAVVEVEGFASDKPFGQTNPESDRLNLQLANERGLKVLTALHIDGTALRRLDSIQAMDNVRPFRSINPEYTDPTEQMARIAIIKIRNAGVCGGRSFANAH